MLLLKYVEADPNYKDDFQQGMILNFTQPVFKTKDSRLTESTQPKIWTKGLTAIISQP